MISVLPRKPSPFKGQQRSTINGISLTTNSTSFHEWGGASPQVLLVGIYSCSFEKFVDHNSTDNTFLTKVDVFEIEQNGQPETSNGQVAHHLSNMGIIELGDDLWIYQNKAIHK